jgi:hypothetical protein
MTKDGGLLLPTKVGSCGVRGAGLFYVGDKPIQNRSLVWSYPAYVAQVTTIGALCETEGEILSYRISDKLLKQAWRERCLVAGYVFYHGTLDCPRSRGNNDWYVDGDNTIYMNIDDPFPEGEANVLFTEEGGFATRTILPGAELIADWHGTHRERPIYLNKNGGLLSHLLWYEVHWPGFFSRPACNGQKDHHGVLALEHREDIAHMLFKAEKQRLILPLQERLDARNAASRHNNKTAEQILCNGGP